MRKFVMSIALMLGLALSAQAVTFHNFNLAGNGGWGDANLTTYVNNHLNGVLGNPTPLKTFNYLGRAESGNGSFAGITVNGLNTPAGNWEYDGDLNIVALILKGGNQGGWLIYNEDLSSFSPGDWAMRHNARGKAQDLSFFAAFSNPKSVPEPGSTLVASLIGLLGLGLLRKRIA